MARETKKAREAREAREAQEARDMAERVWHFRDGTWRRREGLWWLTLGKSTKPYSRDLQWGVSLRHGNHAHASIVGSWYRLGDVDGADMDAIRAAADAWLVEETRALWALVHPQETPAQGED